MKLKIKPMIMVIIAILTTVLSNPLYAKADDDGSVCQVGIFSVYDYKGTGAPITSNLSSPVDIATDLYNAFKVGSAKEWSVAYNWKNSTVWETDFTRPHVGSSYPYVDNVDLAFYIGHGVKPNNYGSKDYSFVLNTNKNSYFVEQANLNLGVRDLEWFITLTCNFLSGTNDDIGRLMRGLHTVCGFQSQIYLTQDAGKILAQKLKSGVSVKEAYFAYGKETQPGRYKHTAAVFTTTNLTNDRIWGYGSVGSDPTVYYLAKNQYVRYYYRCNW